MPIVIHIGLPEWMRIGKISTDSVPVQSVCKPICAEEISTGNAHNENQYS
jgi:hypothetical protein